MSTDDISNMGRRPIGIADHVPTGGWADRYGPEQIQSDAGCKPAESASSRVLPTTRPPVRRSHIASQAPGARVSWLLPRTTILSMATTRNTCQSYRQTADSYQVRRVPPPSIRVITQVPSQAYTFMVWRDLAEWMPMYNPTPQQAEIDRKKAYECGIPHGAMSADNYQVHTLAVCCCFASHWRQPASVLMQGTWPRATNTRICPPSACWSSVSWCTLSLTPAKAVFHVCE